MTPTPISTPTPHSVRRASIADLPTLLPLFAAYRAFYQQPDLPEPAQDYLRERLLRDQAAVWLAEAADGGTLGFALCYPGFCSLLLAPTLLLSDLFVQPSARHSGVAAALMQAVETHARRHGCARLDLSTAHSNHRAQSLYRAQGWVEDSEFAYFNKRLG